MAGRPREQGFEHRRGFGPTAKSDEAQPAAECRLVIGAVIVKHSVEIGQSGRGLAETQKGEAMIGSADGCG
jgi:hypothetical protein